MDFLGIDALSKITGSRRLKLGYGIVRLLNINVGKIGEAKDFCSKNKL